MKIDDVRKTVSNPKPLYFAAGLGDAAVEALKEAPAHLNTLSTKAGVVATDVAGKVAGTAETLQSRITLGQIDPKALLDPKALKSKFSEPDLRAAREKAQTLLLQQVGWALEVAGKAVETYDEYSERGKVVVDRVLYGRGGEAEVVDVQDAPHAPAERIVVEHVTVVDETAETAKTAEAKPAEETKAEAPKAESAKAETPKADTAKPDAAKPTDQANGQKAAPGKPTAPRRPSPRGKKAE